MIARNSHFLAAFFPPAFLIPFVFLAPVFFGLVVFVVAFLPPAFLVFLAGLFLAGEAGLAG
jgi:hypothetical protein